MVILHLLTINKKKKILKHLLDVQRDNRLFCDILNLQNSIIDNSSNNVVLLFSTDDNDLLYPFAKAYASVFEMNQIKSLIIDLTQSKNNFYSFLKSINHPVQEKKEVIN